MTRCTCPGGPLADDGFHAVGCPARRPEPLFTEDERIDGLLEIITSEEGPRLERTERTHLHELCIYDDEGGLWALTSLTAHKWLLPVPNIGRMTFDRKDCTVVWRADVDGLHARCTLLSSEGAVLAQWEAHGNA